MHIFFEGLSCLALHRLPAALASARWGAGVGGGTCLVVQGQFAEGRDVLGPLHQHEQLLLHGLAHVGDIGNLLPSDVSIDHRNRG